MDTKQNDLYTKKLIEKFGTETVEEIDILTMRDKKGNAYCFFINENKELDAKSYNYDEEMKSNEIILQEKLNETI